jgi:ribosomal protein S18 acetylase RimI-like enzyme
MASEIERIPFSEELFSEVQEFNCGELPYEKSVSEWLKRPFGEDGALTSIKEKKRPGRVWLYNLKEETNKKLIGYGALGKGNWKWKGEDDPRIPVTLVIWCGVAKEYQGKPDGDKENRYSYRIFDDLIDIAYQERQTHPVMGLLVHVDNKRAIAFYRSFGFTDQDMMTYAEDGEVYQRMYVILDEEVFTKVLEDAFKKRGK